MKTRLGIYEDYKMVTIKDISVFDSYVVEE